MKKKVKKKILRKLPKMKNGGDKTEKTITPPKEECLGGGGRFKSRKKKKKNFWCQFPPTPKPQPPIKKKTLGKKNNEKFLYKDTFAGKYCFNFSYQGTKDFK